MTTKIIRNAEIKNYWINTSGNEFIQHFVDSMNDPHMLYEKRTGIIGKW